MSSLNILVIDDEPALRQIVSSTLARAGHVADTAAGVQEATAKLKSGEFDVALCDINMPDGDGIDLLRKCKGSGIETVFIMVTAFASLESAVVALRAGAFDYLVKPVRNEELLHRLTLIESMRGLRNENLALRKAVEASSPPQYRFSSPKMLEIERLVCKIAPTDRTVLIVGESGTGKGVWAHAIHGRSARSHGPFVSVNCGAIPENLLESEFFGHTKGAFTGADRTRKGLFLEADGGTLFLDEIGELPIAMQTKLLHVIEDKMVRPVGSEKARQVDCRIIAATNRNLAESIQQGKFREDLYYRLSVFQIAIPPLRERKSDISGLVRFLLAAHACKEDTPQVIDLDPEAEECLLAYGWPGNVRELDNVIKRASILAENYLITLIDLPAELTSSYRARENLDSFLTGPEGSLRDQVRRFEHELIRKAIWSAEGDRRRAAQALGISLSSLYSKLGEQARKS